MTNFDEYRDVFVVADTIDDVVHPVTYELIGQARRIAKELGQLVQVMLLGENVQAEAEELVAHGADIVHVFESPLLKYYTTDGYTKVSLSSHNQHPSLYALIVEIFHTTLLLYNHVPLYDKFQTKKNHELIHFLKLSIA